MCIALYTQCPPSVCGKNVTGDSGGIRTHELLLTGADVPTSWPPSLPDDGRPARILYISGFRDIYRLMKFLRPVINNWFNFTNAVPSLQCISWFKESKHTHRSSFANITNVVPSLQCISWFKESKHTHRSGFANITNVVPSLQCISWFKESKHTHRSGFANITNVVPSLQVLPTLSMLYLPFNVYLDSKRVSVLIEAVLPTLPMQ